MRAALINPAGLVVNIIELDDDTPEDWDPGNGLTFHELPDLDEQPPPPDEAGADLVPVLIGQTRLVDGELVTPEQPEPANPPPSAEQELRAEIATLTARLESTTARLTQAEETSDFMLDALIDKELI